MGVVQSRKRWRRTNGLSAGCVWRYTGIGHGRKLVVRGPQCRVVIRDGVHQRSTIDPARGDRRAVSGDGAVQEGRHVRGAPTERGVIAMEEAIDAAGAEDTTAGSEGSVRLNDAVRERAAAGASATLGVWRKAARQCRPASESKTFHESVLDEQASHRSGAVRRNGVYCSFDYGHEGPAGTSHVRVRHNDPVGKGRCFHFGDAGGNPSARAIHTRPDEDIVNRRANVDGVLDVRRGHRPVRVGRHVGASERDVVGVRECRVPNAECRTAEQQRNDPRAAPPVSASIRHVVLPSPSRPP